jgi:hypothetical protein
VDSCAAEAAPAAEQVPVQNTRPVMSSYEAGWLGAAIQAAP